MHHGSAYSLFVDMRWQATRTIPMERIVISDLARCLG